MNPPFDDALAAHISDAFARMLAAGEPPAVAARRLIDTAMVRIALAVPEDQRGPEYWSDNLGLLLTVATVQLRHGVLDANIEQVALQAVRVVLSPGSRFPAVPRAAAKTFADELHRHKTHQARRAADTVPTRLLPTPVDPSAYDRLVALVSDITERREGSDDGRLAEMLAQFNALTQGTYTAEEVSRHAAAASTDTYVRYLLAGPAPMIEDLSFDEASRVVQALTAGTLKEHDEWYFLDLLEHNLPGGHVRDLIYWPNHWFDDPALLHLKLSSDQIIAYAAGRSGRRLRDASSVDLPHPAPAAAPAERDRSQLQPHAPDTGR
ncbi:hypothetical protein ACTMSW_29490 [Micromonospora sp. BQ11]|uniref:hypothetical protein n=1 Tax=Micromonospora sp. BQ11 TaxID=3452212 RepID=UPI003F8AB24F